MKRAALVLVFVIWLVPSTGRAFPLEALISFLPGLAIARGDRVHRPARPLSGLNLIMSAFNRDIIGKFREAWQRVGNGTDGRESVVMILKMADGGYSARMPNPTNEFKAFTFTWHPATVAIIHTHPNGSRPYPEGGDLTTADKFKVPIFTLTSRGVFVYDPATRKTTKLIDGLDWLEDAAWRNLQLHLGER